MRPKPAILWKFVLAGLAIGLVVEVGLTLA